MKSKKDEILKLRGKGKTYNEIKEILKCSKGTISYHCGVGQKEKYKTRLTKNRKNLKMIIGRKLHQFLCIKVRDFKLDRKKRNRTTASRISYSTAYKMINDNPFCYLTGREINLEKPSTYQLDHKMPLVRGGKNTIKNMGLTCREANMSKWIMTEAEYVQLCVEVCLNNGYVVTKK